MTSVDKDLKRLRFALGKGPTSLSKGISSWDAPFWISKAHYVLFMHHNASMIQFDQGPAKICPIAKQTMP
jgi:hypothetical protein